MVLCLQHHPKPFIHLDTICSVSEQYYNFYSKKHNLNSKIYNNSRINQIIKVLNNIIYSKFNLILEFKFKFLIKYIIFILIETD